MVLDSVQLVRWLQSTIRHGWGWLVSGVRQIPLGQKKAFDMICVRCNGTFYEAVPLKAGKMEWKVETWGSAFSLVDSRHLKAPFEVQVSYTCDLIDIPGLVFRALLQTRECFTLSRHLRGECDFVTVGAGVAYSYKVAPPLIDQVTSALGGAATAVESVGNSLHYVII
jgi:hypothetical protein